MFVLVYEFLFVLFAEKSENYHCYDEEKTIKIATMDRQQIDAMSEKQLVAELKKLKLSATGKIDYAIT